MQATETSPTTTLASRTVPASEGPIVQLLSTSYCTGDLRGADTTYLRATSLIDAHNGPEDPDLIEVLRARAGVVRQLGRPAEADSLEARAQKVEDALKAKGD